MSVIHHGDCLEWMRTLPDRSVDLILTDPPYFKVKDEPWDRQWDKPGEFLAWLGTLADEWRRILAPNGSLYVFASPQMQARVECEIAKRFAVVNSIVWSKPPHSTKAEMFRKTDLRSFFPATERIVFAEHYGADNMAKGEAGYAAKCDELRGFVFEPIRAYLADERDRAGLSTTDVAAAFREKTGNAKSGMAGHWFVRSQWALPTRENYEWLRDLFRSSGAAEPLRREYEDLRREYEDLRRPFTVTADVPYTDVWRFETVGRYPGKHPCEKPQALLRHMIASSSRPGALVLDCFAGSGATGVAALALGRRFVGAEMSDHWHAYATKRLEAEARGAGQLQLRAAE